MAGGAKAPFARASALNSRQAIDIIGDPGRIRTSDLQLRRLLLYPLSYGAMPPGSIYRISHRNARLIALLGVPVNAWRVNRN